MSTMLAARAAIAMQAARQRDRAEHLARALATNRVIGVAMGVIMARSHVGSGGGG